MGKKSSYKKRMIERRNIISKMDVIRPKIQKLKENMENLEKQLEACQKKKVDLEKQLGDLEAIYMKDINVVGESEGFEIENGLSGMKRDINLKLVEHLDEDKIRQVFFSKIKY
jgi:predicted RNase H-like nuclease (RuvC/YqgF family)